MKITSFYYLNYPDRMPENPRNAASEVYVEVGDSHATQNQFAFTYAFKVYTIDYIKNEIFRKGGPFLVDRSVIIVDRFDDKLIKTAIESVLSNIDYYGIKKG